MLPVAAVDEHKRRPFFTRFEKVDTIALARAVSEVEMAGMSRTQLQGKPFPAGDDVGASSHGNAVVEAEITLFLAHIAPVRRIGRRSHAQISNCGAKRRRVSTLPENVLQDYPPSRSGNVGRKNKWHLIRDWCGRPRARSSTNSTPARSRRSICSTCWRAGLPRSTAR